MITGVSHDDRNIAGKRTEKLGAVYNQSNFKATTTSTQLTTAWQTQDPTEQICSESSRSKQMCRKFSDSVSEKIQATDLFTPLFHLSVLWAEVSNIEATTTTVLISQPKVVDSYLPPEVMCGRQTAT